MTDLNGKKIAIIATDHFEEAELVTPRDELTKAGAEVRIYSTGSDPIQAVEGDTEPTQKVDVDGTFGDLDVASVDAVVVPGGTVNADHIRVDEDAQDIVREALDTDKVVAVICHGPWLLINAGRREGPHPDQLPEPVGRPRERRRHLEGRGGRGRRQADHQPQPRRPPRLRRGDQRGARRAEGKPQPLRRRHPPAARRSPAPRA